MQESFLIMIYHIIEHDITSHRTEPLDKFNCYHYVLGIERESGGNTMARYSNDMVAHIWAQGNKDSGKSNNGQFYFEGRELYSYGSHYLAGFLMPDGTALLNADSYSPTTGKHMSYAARAVAYKYHSIRDLTGMRWILRDLAKGSDRKELRATMCRIVKERLPMSAETSLYLLGLVGLDGRTLNRIENEWRKANEKAKAKRIADDRARKERDGRAYAAEDINAWIKREMENWNPRYVIERRALYTFQIIRDTKLPKTIVAKLKAQRKLLRETLLDIDARKARRELMQEKRRAVDWFRIAKDRDIQIAPLHELLQAQRHANTLISSHGVPSATRAKLREISFIAGNRITALREAAEREAFEKKAKEREEWLNGTLTHAYGLKDEQGGALMRIKGETLQTSLGAEVPLSHAIRVFRFVKLCRMNGTAWRRNGHSIRVGHFTVDSIEPNGDFIAGCHSFHWPEVERVARLAGVADEAPSNEAVS